MVNACPICPVPAEPDVMLPLAPPGPNRAAVAAGETRGTGVAMQTVQAGG